MEPTRATKLTIYVGDSDRHGRKPLHLAIVELLHEESVSGATVLHGIEGYGSHKQIHTARILDLSGDLPVVIVAVDRPEKIEAVLPKLDEMIGGGLVTTEDVRIITSRPPLHT
jgi:PII-like signaling protein